jgi:UDP-N-acetylmuramate dehydrogenase
MYTPENVPELRDIVAELKGNYYLLSAGSNVIFSNQVSRPIINLMKVDETMAIEDDVFTCGCSVRIQKFIRYAKDNGFGGIEFLYSLPASMGGIVYMNAGRGGGKRLSISDFLTEVTYLDCDSNEIRSEGIDKRQFSHHISPFQNKNCVIISCKLKLRRQTVEETELLIQERLDHCKKVQDSSVPNCGSTFSKGNKYIFKIFQMFGIKSGGAKFSKKTSDWIINTGGATSVDIKRLIKKMINVHKLIGADYKVEYQFFD